MSQYGLGTWEGSLIIEGGLEIGILGKETFNFYFSHGHSLLLVNAPFYFIIEADIGIPWWPSS